MKNKNELAQSKAFKVKVVNCKNGYIQLFSLFLPPTRHLIYWL